MRHSAETKKVLLEQLRDEIMGQAMPPPCGSPETLVFGEGNLDAKLALIGEAPGEQEERQRRPFVGRAGQLLRRTLTEAGISPENVWISNLVKCRPTAIQAGKTVNRTPTVSEAKAWLPYLLREIGILQPAVILCLGNLASKALIHKDFKISGDRGQWRQGPIDVIAMGTYHPSYVLRQTAYGSESVRLEFLHDIYKVKQRLEDA